GPAGWSRLTGAHSDCRTESKPSFSSATARLQAAGAQWESQSTSAHRRKAETMNEPRRTRTTTSHPSARPRRTVLAATGAAAALALAVGGLAGLPAQAMAEARTQATAPTAGVRAEAATPFTGHPSSPNGSSGNGESSSPADGTGTPSSGATAPEEQTEATPADEQEATGVVLIDTELGYEKAEAAGTGIVLSKDGLVLTNNHVIADSTKIAVTVATTGKTYTASVV